MMAKGRFTWFTREAARTMVGSRRKPRPDSNAHPHAPIHFGHGRQQQGARAFAQGDFATDRAVHDPTSYDAMVNTARLPDAVVAEVVAALVRAKHHAGDAQ